jgi:hypothetical protein
MRLQLVGGVVDTMAANGLGNEAPRIGHTASRGGTFWRDRFGWCADRRPKPMPQIAAPNAAKQVRIPITMRADRGQSDHPQRAEAADRDVFFRQVTDRPVCRSGGVIAVRR